MRHRTAETPSVPARSLRAVARDVSTLTTNLED